MRIVLIVALVAFAIWIFIAGLKNKRRVSGIAIFVLLAPAAALGYFEYKWLETVAVIDEAVVEVSGNKDASFDCQRMSLAFFDVWASERTTTEAGPVVGLKYKSCDLVMKWIDSENKSEISFETTEAMQLLTQETMRVSGVKSVAEQKCLGIRNMSAMVQYLGGSEAQGTYFYRFYKQESKTDYDITKYNC